MGINVMASADFGQVKSESNREGADFLESKIRGRGQRLLKQFAWVQGNLAFLGIVQGDRYFSRPKQSLLQLLTVSVFSFL
jgi:hypothetical protein